jgi:hypothetical protein
MKLKQTNIKQNKLVIKKKPFARMKKKTCPTCNFDVLVMPGTPVWSNVDSNSIPVRCPGHYPNCGFSYGDKPGSREVT